MTFVGYIIYKPSNTALTNLKFTDLEKSLLIDFMEKSANSVENLRAHHGIF